MNSKQFRYGFVKYPLILAVSVAGLWGGSNTIKLSLKSPLLAVLTISTPNMFFLPLQVMNCIRSNSRFLSVLIKPWFGWSIGSHDNGVG